MFEIIPAPLRTFKTWSIITGMLLAVADAALLAIKSFTDLHIMTAETALMINAVVVSVIVPLLRIIKQQIEATPTEKIALMGQITEAPTKAEAVLPAVPVPAEKKAELIQAIHDLPAPPPPAPAPPP